MSGGKVSGGKMSGGKVSYIQILAFCLPRCPQMRSRSCNFQKNPAPQPGALPLDLVSIG